VCLLLVPDEKNIGNLFGQELNDFMLIAAGHQRQVTYGIFKKLTFKLQQARFLFFSLASIAGLPSPLLEIIN